MRSFIFVALILILGGIYKEVLQLRRMLEHISEKITSKPSL